MDADDMIGDRIGGAAEAGGKLRRPGRFSICCCSRSRAPAACTGHRAGGTGRPAVESGKVSDWPSFGGALLGGSGGRALTVTIDRRKRQKQLARGKNS